MTDQQYRTYLHDIEHAMTVGFVDHRCGLIKAANRPVPENLHALRVQAAGRELKSCEGNVELGLMEDYRELNRARALEICEEFKLVSYLFMPEKTITEKDSGVKG